jgi:hypothetical protein
MTKDSDEDWIRIKNRFREARKKESRLSIISAKKPKVYMSHKESWNQKHSSKPIIVKNTFWYGVKLPNNYKSTGSNDLTNPDSQTYDQKSTSKYKIQNIIKSGLQGFISKHHNRNKTYHLEPKTKNDTKSRYINRPELQTNNLKNIHNSRPPVEKSPMMSSEITDLYQFEDTKERPYNNDVDVNGVTWNLWK